MNDEPHSNNHSHSTKHLNSSFSSEIENNNNNCAGFKRKSVDDSDLNRSQDSTKNDVEFLPPQPYKYQRSLNSSKNSSHSNQFYSTPPPPPPPPVSSSSSAAAGLNHPFYHQSQYASASGSSSQIPFSFVLPTPPSANNPNMFAPPISPSNSQLASHNQLSKSPITSSTNSQLLSHLNYSNTQSPNSYYQNHSILSHNLHINQQQSPGSASSSTQSKSNQQAHHSAQSSPLATNSNTVNTGTQGEKNLINLEDIILLREMKEKEKMFNNCNNFFFNLSYGTFFNQVKKKKREIFQI